MAINSRIKFLILAAVFFSGLSVVHGQTASPTAGYFLDPNSAEPRFIQRLAWSGGAYALHCEIIIEKEEGSGYVSYLRNFTKENHFDISLPPGNYRFRVIPYDVLDKPSAGTGWENFKVYNAIKPELYKPEELDYFNDKQGSKFEFSGNNIEPEAKIYFVNSSGERIEPVEIIRSWDGSSVRLVFDKGQLTDGEYDVLVVNPGGLETSIDGIDYKTYREKFGLLHYVVGVSFMPSFQFYGNTIRTGDDIYFINARASVISCLFLENYIGMEFSFSRYTGFSSDNFYVTGKTSGYTFGYNLVFINWMFGRKAAVNFRIGLGFELSPMDLNYVNLCVSYQYQIFRQFYIEAGVNFCNTIFYNMNSDIQPWIGLTMVF